MPKQNDMRMIIELTEEVEEVNYFLQEWRRLKQMDGAPISELAEPELKFLVRTLGRLIDQARVLDMPLILSDTTLGDTAESSHVSGIRLTEYLRVQNNDGEPVAYVGNDHGLLSIARLADMVAKGRRLKLQLDKQS